MQVHLIHLAYDDNANNAASVIWGTISKYKIVIHFFGPARARSAQPRAAFYSSQIPLTKKNLSLLADANTEIPAIAAMSIDRLCGAVLMPSRVKRTTWRVCASILMSASNRSGACQLC